MSRNIFHLLIVRKRNSSRLSGLGEGISLCQGTRFGGANTKIILSVLSLIAWAYGETGYHTSLLSLYSRFESWWAYQTKNPLFSGFFFICQDLPRSFRICGLPFLLRRFALMNDVLIGLLAVIVWLILPFLKAGSWRMPLRSNKKASPGIYKRRHQSLKAGYHPQAIRPES